LKVYPDFATSLADPNNESTRSVTLLRFGAPSALWIREATYTGDTSPGCAALSGFFNLSTPCSPQTRHGLVSCRRHSWGFSLQSLPLAGIRASFDVRSPLDVTLAFQLHFPWQAMVHFTFPPRPPSGGCPSSKSVHTMPGVNPNHRSRCSPGFPPLQGSPRPRDGHAFTLPPLTHLSSALVLRRVPPLRPMPQSFTHAACGWSPEGDCRPSWGSFPCHS
jgi:hypothetical protein